jgi:hypothetical protein
MDKEQFEKLILPKQGDEKILMDFQVKLRKQAARLLSQASKKS